MGINITAYRRLHQGLKLWARHPLDGKERRLCQSILGDLEQAVHEGVPLSERRSFNFGYSSIAYDSALANQLGQCLDRGVSAFFLTYRPEKVFRYIAELLPAIDICVKDWQIQPVRIPYWKELFAESHRSLRGNEPSRECVKALFPLLETFRDRRSVTWRRGSSLGQDMAEYLSEYGRASAFAQELCHEVAQLLLQPDDLVLLAVGSPNAWVRRIGMEYLRRGGEDAYG